MLHTEYQPTIPCHSGEKVDSYRIFLGNMIPRNHRNLPKTPLKSRKSPLKTLKSPLVFYIIAILYVECYIHGINVFLHIKKGKFQLEN